VPAPAVIPALKVYINTVVVKTPVVNQRVIVIDLTSTVRNVSHVLWVIGRIRTGPRSLTEAKGFAQVASAMG